VLQRLEWLTRAAVPVRPCTLGLLTSSARMTACQAQDVVAENVFKDACESVPTGSLPAARLVRLLVNVVRWNEPVERRHPSPPRRIVQRHVTKPPREEHLSRRSTNTWWSSRRLRSTSRAALW
jgi:hypothetical protein